MIPETQVREIVRQAVEKAMGKDCSPSPSPSPQPAQGAPRDRSADAPRARRVVGEDEVRHTARGETINVKPDALVTPLAQTLAKERGVGIGSQPAAGKPDGAAARAWNRVVALGSDHGGFEMKEDLRSYLKELGYLVRDCGTKGPEAVDYPDFALAVAAAVSNEECWRGIMVDGAGIGSCMVANKVPGVRAAMCYDLASAKNSREHNDANVLTLGGRMIAKDAARQVVKVFLETACTEERHLKRVRKIMDVERRFLRK
jgi:ribose 5-phosphate isomerase B